MFSHDESCLWNHEIRPCGAYNISWHFGSRVGSERFDWLLVGPIGRNIFFKDATQTPLETEISMNQSWFFGLVLVGFNWLIRFQVLAHPIMFIHILHHFPWTCAVYRSLWNLPNGCGNSSCSVVGFCDCYFPMARAKDATQNICGCKDALKYWKSHLNLGKRHETKTL